MSGSAHASKVSSAPPITTFRIGGPASNQIWRGDGALVLVAVMRRCARMAPGRIVNRMRCRRAGLRCNVLRAPQMHRRFTGNFGSETEANAAVIATFIRHRAHRVALRMIAGSSAWTASRSGSGNHYDAHVFTLAVCSAPTWSISASVEIQIRTPNYL